MSAEAMYRRLADRLRNRPALPPLRPEHVWHPGLDAEIAALPLPELAGGRADGPDCAAALTALLHLWNDSLDAAHDRVQHLATPTGSALHGIMHRREGDFDNAKYWFRRAGDHPAWHGLQSRAAAWLKEAAASRGWPAGAIGQGFRTIASQGMWNPYLFTDLAAMADGRDEADGAVSMLVELQVQELVAFLRYLESRLL